MTPPLQKCKKQRKKTSRLKKSYAHRRPNMKKAVRMCTAGCRTSVPAVYPAAVDANSHHRSRRQKLTVSMIWESF